MIKYGTIVYGFSTFSVFYMLENELAETAESQIQPKFTQSKPLRQQDIQ